MALSNSPMDESYKTECAKECGSPTDEGYQATREKYPGSPMIMLPNEVFRVIDNGTCVLTTLSPRKALMALMKLIETYGITDCWADREDLK
jgi:hypothetical protein